MKFNKWLTVAATVLMMAGTSRAAHVWEDPGAWWNGMWVYDREAGPKFTAHELSLDLFGSYMHPEREFDEIFKTDIRTDAGRWGGGVGLNYFLVPQVGIGADMTMSEGGGPFIDQVLGSLFLRLPWESAGLAPYIFGGGGRGIDPDWEWLGHAGVGLEFRFNPAMGIFADSRYIWADETADRLQIRAGFRLLF